MAGVSTTTRSNTADADGGTTVFNFTFFAYSTDTIKVYSVLDDVLTPITSGITKAINSNFIGGTVTFAVAPADAVGDILIRREVPYTQTTELADLTRYKETAIEQALNLIVLQVQQVSEEVGRALKYSESGGVSDTIVEAPVDGSLLAFDGTTGRITTKTVASLDLSGLDVSLTGLSAEDFLKYDGTNWVNRSASEVRTDLSLGTAALKNTGTSGDAIPLLNTNLTFSGDVTFTGDIIFTDDGELTIASGVITTTGANHTVDTESDAASDDLDTITAGSDGQILKIRANNAARTVVIKDGTGNIETPDGNDIDLDETEKSVTFIYDGTLSKWVVQSVSAVSNNGVLQVVHLDTPDTSTLSSGSTIPQDSSIPQSSEGTQIFSQSFTPRKSTSIILIEVEIFYTGVTNNPNLAAAIFVDSGADAICACATDTPTAGEPHTLSFRCEVAAGSTSARTYKVRAGPVTGTSNLTLNPYFSTAGAIATSMKITEVAA